MTAGFERFPGMLLLLPAFLATRGTSTARWGAHLERSPPGPDRSDVLVEPTAGQRDRRFLHQRDRHLDGHRVPLVGILQALGRESARLIELIGIMLVSGVLTSFTLIFGLLALVFASYKYGLDPDNLIGPIVTTLGDVFGVVFLFVALTVVGVVF